MDRFKHVCYCLGACLVCAAMSVLPMMWAIEGFDGSVESPYKRASEVLFSERPLTFLWNMLIWWVFGLGFVGASLYWFIVAWWGQTRTRF